MNKSVQAVEAVLASLPAESKKILEKIRKTIKTIVPEAMDEIVYGVPGLRYKGKGLAAYAANKDNFGYYPMSPKLIVDNKKELEGFKTSKGAIQFEADHLLPDKLIEKLVRSRVEEIEATTR